MPSWLVIVPGEATDRITGLMAGAPLCRPMTLMPGSGPGPVHSFTVRVDADSADQASAQVADVLGERASFMLDVMPSGE